MNHALVARDVTSRDVREGVAPAVVGCILTSDDHQFVGEPQLRVELDDQELVVGETTGVELATWTGRRRRRTHRGVDARSLEMSRHADVEPQLVQVVWNASTNVAAERVPNVVVDRLQRVPKRIACTTKR